MQARPSSKTQQNFAVRYRGEKRMYKHTDVKKQTHQKLMRYAAVVIAGTVVSTLWLVEPAADRAHAQQPQENNDRVQIVKLEHANAINMSNVLQSITSEVRVATDNISNSLILRGDE